MTTPVSVLRGASGRVWTIVLNRPHARNAVDRPTADALVEAFTAFELDKQARVAVLWGDGGTFCSGADLKAIATGDEARANAVSPPQVDRPFQSGPMVPSASAPALIPPLSPAESSQAAIHLSAGADAHGAFEACHSGDRGFGGRWRAGARVLVRSARLRVREGRLLLTVTRGSDGLS